MSDEEDVDKMYIATIGEGGALNRLRVLEVTDLDKKTGSQIKVLFDECNTYYTLNGEIVYHVKITPLFDDRMRIERTLVEKVNK